MLCILARGQGNATFAPDAAVVESTDFPLALQKVAAVLEAIPAAQLSVLLCEERPADATAHQGHLQGIFLVMKDLCSCPCVHASCAMHGLQRLQYVHLHIKTTLAGMDVLCAMSASCSIR